MELPGDFPGKEKGQVWDFLRALGQLGDIWAQGVATASVGSWVVTFGCRFGQECPGKRLRGGVSGEMGNGIFLAGIGSAVVVVSTWVNSPGEDWESSPVQ